jgi:cytochrome c biogenesis protein CcmG/thiol:disulfide interchange protein DsbE
MPGAVMLIVISGVVGFGLTRQHPMTKEGSAQVNQQAPGFTLTSLSGHPWSLDDFRGRPIIINFWASWCTPCATEAPALERAAQIHRDTDLVFIGVDVLDTKRDGTAFVAKHGLSYTNLFDPQGDVQSIYGSKGVPFTVFIDRAGVIKYISFGPLDDRSLRDLTNKIST